MGPNRAAKIFAERCPEVDSYRVTLYGSLAATGEGHMTDIAIIKELEPIAKLELIWEPDTFLPFHPNGMLFEGIKDGKVIDCFTVSQAETPNIGSVCADEEFYGQFVGKTEADYEEIDMIAGATLTTNGYKKAILRAFESVKILEGGAGNEE